MRGGSATKKTGGDPREDGDLDYFFCGTMRDRDVLETVVGRRVADADMEAATLPGYHLARAIEESYPALVPQTGCRVDGVLVHRLSATDVARISWFEGREFAPRSVTVVLRNGTRAPASIFVPTENLEITGDEWDFHRWRCSEKDLLMTLVRGHMKLFGRATQDEAIRVWDETRERHQTRRAAATRHRRYQRA